MPICRHWTYKKCGNWDVGISHNPGYFTISISNTEYRPKILKIFLMNFKPEDIKKVCIYILARENNLNWKTLLVIILFIKYGLQFKL